MNISKANLLKQIKRSDIDKLLSSLHKLRKIIKLPPININLWRNIYDQVCSDLFAKMGAGDPTPPRLKIYGFVKKKYCQKDVKYAEALSQRQEKIGQIMGEIEHILRLKSVEPLLRYDREQSGNLRVIARQIEDHTNDEEWYFLDNDKWVINAIVFLRQTKNKLPLWYDEQTEQKPTEARLAQQKDQAKMTKAGKSKIEWVADQVENLVAKYPTAVSLFKERVRIFNGYCTEYLKKKKDKPDDCQPSPLLWEIDDKLSCYYATLAVIHDAVKTKAPVGLSESLDTAAGFLYQNAAQQKSPYGDTGLDTAIKYVRADIEKHQNEQKPTEASGGKAGTKAERPGTNAGQAEKPPQKTPETDSELIYQTNAATFYNIPKATLSKAAKKQPSEPGYLWSDHKGKRVFYRKDDLNKLARSRTRLRNV